MSEEDLFEDDGYYGGKSYGSKGSVATSSRSKQSSISQGDAVDGDDEAAAWAQYYEADIDTQSFPERTKEALIALRDAATAAIDEEKWTPSQLDAERNDYANNDQVKASIEFVSRDLVEREEESRLVVLAMLAQEHLLLLGPPGTGKSMVARRLGDLVSDGGGFFQRLLTKFTTPEELFGPLSLRALENDEYKRVTDGFLPSASVAFLDEIFKANSAILNTLLTILNERKFDNGGTREDCPVRCVIGASNELPEDEELDALYDRFLLRKEVKAVSDEGLFQLLTVNPSADIVGMSAKSHDAIDNFSFDEASAALSGAADTVTIPDHIASLIRNMRTFMNDELDVEVSDRRLVQSARLLRLSAATHGRKYVDPIDCLLLQDIVWRLPEERSIIRQWLWGNLTPGGEGSDAEILQYKFLLDGLRASVVESVRATGGDITGNNGARKEDVAAIAALREEVIRISGLIQALWDALARHSNMLVRDHIWLSPDETKAAQQLLQPKARKSMEVIEQVLVNARGLELALSDDLKSVINDDVRLAVIEGLWVAGENGDSFSDDELDMSTREAKQNFDDVTFRAWRKAKKKMKKKGQ